MRNDKPSRVPALRRAGALSKSVVLAVVRFELVACGSYDPEPVTAAQIRERTPYYGRALTRHQTQKALWALEKVGMVRRCSPAEGTVWVRWLGEPVERVVDRACPCWGYA